MARPFCCSRRWCDEGATPPYPLRRAFKAPPREPLSSCSCGHFLSLRFLFGEYLSNGEVDSRVRCTKWRRAKRRRKRWTDARGRRGKKDGKGRGGGREGRRWRKNEAEEEEEDREKEAKEKRAEETHERWIIVKRGKLVVDYSDSNDRVWEFLFSFSFRCPECTYKNAFLSSL